METPTSDSYKLTLSGSGIKIDKSVTAEVASRIALLVLGVSAPTPSVSAGPTSTEGGAVASPGMGLAADTTIKSFIGNKKPLSEVERVTCLAYYLADQMNTPSFKTVQLTKLNTEAAAPRLSNASYTARNAVSQGYLAPAGGGKKQITTRGEALVTALPDRDAVKQALAANPIPKKRTSASKKPRQKQKDASRTQ